METQDLDVVYSVKESEWNEELRYSLRSLKNLPHRDVYIYGGAPSWINRDTVKIVKTEQNTGNKWENTAKGLKAICENENISDYFIWFNDDFFVIKKTAEIGYYCDRTLNHRVADFSDPTNTRSFYSWWGKRNPYVGRLQKAIFALNRERLPHRNFELHVPMVFSKKHLLETINKFPGIGAKRSLYGNSYIDPCEITETQDVKIWERTGRPKRGGLPFVSTDDRSFADGEIGEYLRKKFNTPSIYEKGE